MAASQDETLFRTWLDDHRGIMLKVVRSFAPSREDGVYRLNLYNVRKIHLPRKKHLEDLLRSIE